MSSILTNTSSMIALETLRGINRSLETSQSEISSGKKITSARDNTAVWAVSTVMNADVAGFKTISESLSLGSATVGVARSVTEKVVSTLEEIKSLIVQAQDESVDRAKYQADIDEKINLVETYVASAQFNGLNLIDGLTAGAVNVLASLDRDTTGAVSASYIVVTRQNLSTAAGGGLEDLTSIDVVTNASAGLAAVETALTRAIDAAAAFGSSQSRIEKQDEFIKTLVDSMNTGIGALVDTDLETASARLQALQVQQQLGVQSLSIANETPRAVLALLRQ